MIDSCIAIQLYFPTPLDIFINQFNRNFSEIDTVLFVSSFLCSPNEYFGALAPSFSVEDPLRKSEHYHPKQGK